MNRNNKHKNNYYKPTTHKTKHTQTVLSNQLTAQDKKNLSIIDKTIKDKIINAINEYKEKTGEEIKYVSINYFNTSALSKPTAMNVVDFVSEDVDHNINYLTIMVYFGEHHINTMTAHTMMKFLSEKHVWRNSTDKLAVDLNGVIITNYDPTKAGVIKLPTQEEDTTDGTR